MYKYDRKKELIKSAVYITFILLLAIVSTYYIYYKFQDSRNIDFNSESLDVTYHESTGDKITISKITPVTDSVGLSSKAYNISVTNNLTERINYIVKIVNDKNSINIDNCQDRLITKENIRISIKVNKNKNEIYNLNELEKGILLVREIKALDEDNLSIRIWIDQDSILPVGSDMHYHGKIRIIEGETINEKNS